MADNNPVIIKKITKRKHGGHHGGSWKVAYADFVTAMMAFFLLMWLLNSTSETQKQQLSEFFEDPILFMENKKVGGRPSIVDFGGLIRTSETPITETKDEITDFDRDKLAEKIEKEKLLSLKYAIDNAIADSLVLSDFKEQLKLELTPEGLRIQIIDEENRSMFDIGSSHLTEHAYLILEELGTLLNQVPNRVSISGHTDATPFSDSNSNYSNWELSTDRANSARRAFLEAGMPKEKIGRVVGLASSVLLDKEDPFNDINRRISIMVLNKKTSESIGLNSSEDETQAEDETILDEETSTDEYDPQPTHVFLPF